MWYLIVSIPDLCTLTYFYSNRSPTKNGVYFSIYALVLLKALQIRVFFSIFALILTKAPPQRVFYSIFALPKILFFVIFTFFNRSPTKKGVFLYIALNLTKALHKGCFLLVVFCLFLTKALPQRVFNSFFALILTKTQPKLCFSLFLPLFQPKPYKKGVFLYFALILIKTLPKMVFSLFLPLF